MSSSRLRSGPSTYVCGVLGLNRTLDPVQSLLCPEREIVAGHVGLPTYLRGHHLRERPPGLQRIGYNRDSLWLPAPTAGEAPKRR